MNLCFLGDISFNDEGKTHKLDLSDFFELNSKTSFTIGNLEALASLGEKNLLKNPRVTTTLDALNKLKDIGVNLVTLAHNHVYDAKLSGFKASLEKLDELGIFHIGAGLTLEEAEKPFILEKDNLKIGFLNYCTSDTNPSLPNGCEVFLNLYDKTKIQKDILKLKNECDKIILILHWGGSFEGGYYPDKYQIKEANLFTKIGANLIIGHHPHTLQPNMVINSEPVYFSLGNFIFYDIKHEGKTIKLSPRRKRGGILRVSVSKDKSLIHKLYYSNQTKNSIKISSIGYNSKFRNLIFKLFYKLPLFYTVYRVKFKYINPILYFILVQEGGINKYKKLNLNKLKRFLWKK